MNIPPEPTKPGQESVWDYPRPAIAEANRRHLQIIHKGVEIASTHAGYRTLETSHPPTYYFPPEDVTWTHLCANPKRSLCEWKGQARYLDATIDGDSLEAAAWTYPEPTASFAMIRNHVAFYPEPFDQCLVDGETVTPQPGGFYGGWITSHVAGPFKGIPGSRFW
ncbi:DUF427 domain-containing protein [Sphingorhabdus sp. EL138]|uniref:DUF427 domain-containing protein n=1 Tax=Sphingorhabdus sp. EL138 TaxID=2073156 RepID=UPI000D697480|nr:DUF427 domain-containing protein [Sphingorhabdus sp. EL138]